MLVSKTYNEGDVVTFKLVNGDEIIGKIVAEHSDYFEIENPSIVVQVQQGLGLMPGMFTAGKQPNAKLQKMHVMLHSLTVNPWINHYIGATTGVEIASAGDIIV